MNLENIKSGMVIKNYPCLCQLLDEPVKGGNSKKAQLRRWKQYFSFMNCGHKLIIIDVYQEAKIMTDLRSFGNNTIYGHNIQRLLMDTLARRARNNEQEMKITTTQILYALSMVNNNYVRFRRTLNAEETRKKLVYSEIDVKVAAIDNFLNITHNKLKKTVEQTFNRLERQGYIFWSRVIIVVEKIEEASEDIHEEHREASNDEIETILQCKKEVLNTLGLLDEKDVIVHKKWLGYVKKLNARIKEKTKGKIKYMYVAYKLILNRKGIKIKEEDFKHFTLAREAAFKIRKELNETSAESLLISNDKRYLSKNSERKELVKYLILFLNGNLNN